MSRFNDNLGISTRFTLVVAIASVAPAAFAGTPADQRALVADPPTLEASRSTEPVSSPTLDRQPEAIHPAPWLKLSYRQFSISNLDATTVPLSGLELDTYPLSSRWLRGGLTVAGGKGRGRMGSTDVNLRYGLLGVAAGLQYPARLTPFVEGRFSGGILAGTANGEVTIPGTTVSITGASAATWIYGRGVDLGVEVLAVKPVLVSASIGWLRTTWRGVDAAAITQDSLLGIRLKDLTADSLTLKVGIGF